jgi:MYXO-CTERM domain-containing protein
MKKVTLAAVGFAGLMTTGTVLADDLYDNGGPDGVNGYSNATVNVFGARRTILDDFVLAEDSTLMDFHWEHIWNTFPAGSGSGLELSFRSDAGGSPGAVVATAAISSYTEVGTGATYFSRPGAESWVEFDGIDLAAGTYWFDATIVGPENNFWLTTSVKNNECWVNYDDLGGLQPGSSVFGVASDVNFRITGRATPAPGALALLGLAGLAGSRRRRA